MSTTSAPSEPSAVQGNQCPRIFSAPDWSTTAGSEAVDLARQVGLNLDPWQQFVLEQSLGEKPKERGGGWSAFEVGLVVSRQNGKGALLEARSLAGLFLFDEQVIMHTAHLFATALESFRRLLFWVEDNPDLRRRVKRISRSHGEEGFELMTGQRIMFKARTLGGGRGFTGDVVFMDEAMILDERPMGALMPTLSARPNPQLWYTGSAGGLESHVFARVRRRGIEGDPGLAFFEWSADPKLSPSDPAAWAAANPAMGIRISPEHIELERRSLDEESFARERLGVWPDPVTSTAVIAADVWLRVADFQSKPLDPVTFAVDVSPNGESAAIASAGRRADGLSHVEIADYKPGTGWVVERVRGMVDKWRPAAVLLDHGGPAGALVNSFEEAGVALTNVTAQDMKQACGGFYDAVVNQTMRHRNTTELNKALAGAKTRQLGDAWAWHRRDSSVDISPLVAATLALYGHASGQTANYDLLASVF